jgi:AhpD family alkylhydroperoxidase
MTMTSTESAASTSTLEARMTHPAFVVPGAMDALMALNKSMDNTGLSPRLRELVHLRASQINGCGACAVQHNRIAKKLGETDERLWAVATWRDAPYFDDAEKAALALAEDMTRLADADAQVSDAVWEQASAHYDEPQLAALVMTIAQINLWNRLNVATRQVAGGSW